MEMLQTTVEQKIKAYAEELGFEACGIAPATVSARHEYVTQWLADGKAGEMVWLAKNAVKRLNPQEVLPGAKSMIVVALNYYSEEERRQPGRIARYARGGDYHKLMEPRLKQLSSFVQTNAGGEVKWYSDTGPVLEREVAARAGVGWQGKSTMLISKKLGTWFFLGEVLATASLQGDTSLRDHCGSCTRCIRSCPTQAITAPYQLDARRCIAYLTIEHRGAIPQEFREAIGDRIFGCDECLDACPWNRFAQTTREEKLKPDPSFSLFTLQELLQLTEEEFKHHFQHSPIKRLKLRGLIRNVCVALGNVGNFQDIALLNQKISEKDELISEHANWAVAQIQRRLLI